MPAGACLQRIVTFRKWTDEDLLRLVPREQLLVSPTPLSRPGSVQGQRNEPAWVAHTLSRLAAARGEDAGELGRITAANAARLFGLALAAA